MPTSERIILDPPEVALGSRTELDITPWLGQEGIDWGEASIEPFLADKDRGSVPVDFRVPNREIEAPLRLVVRGGTTAIAARAAIQAKVALFQKEGGWIKRLTNSGGTVYADVVNASFSAASVAGFESKQDIDLDAHLTLTCLPDFYEQEVTLGDHVETSNPELVFTETGIDGDYPARVRVMVDDDQGQDMRGLLWGFRSRYYDSSATAALKYNAEALEPLDTASKVALSGASGGTVVKHGTLSTNWTPVLGTNKGGTAYLTHKGTYRLYARVYSASGTLVQARAVWDVGDLVNPVENDAWRLPGASNFYLHDFGEIRLDASPVGTHRWQGQIQAKGDTGGETISIDRIELVPVDEGMGVLTAPIPATRGAATYSARSEFNTESGSITGDSLAVGGTWVGSGDANDFLVSAGVATRAVGSDSAGFQNGRLIRASVPSLGNAAVSVDFKKDDFVDPVGALALSGVLLRYTDVNNFLAVYYDWTDSGHRINVVKRVASTPGTISSQVDRALSSYPTSFWTLQAQVDTNGNYFVWWVPQGAGLGAPQMFGADSALAGGGALASGKVGIIDHWAHASTPTRTYDNFSAWVPTYDAVTFASRSTQLTTDGHYRLDTGGTAYGPVSIQSGDLPRLPVAGLEGRTTEIFLKPSRGDFDSLPDSGIDDVSARVYYSPSWLVAPDQ